MAKYLGRKAEEVGVEIYPGFPASEVLYGEGGEVRGIATGDLGIAKSGEPRDDYTRGMELRAKYTIFAEGARGSLTKTLIDRYKLNQDRDHQKYGLGVKELWQVPDAVFRPGLVQHTMGWPLPNKAGGGSWLYHFDDNLVSVGFVTHLNYENPTLSPFDEFQRFKTHPMIRDTFAGAKRIGYGARAIMEGGWQSVPKLVFPGGALVGCSAGFVNVPRIKGSHNAILSGMLCAEHVFGALHEGRAHDEVTGYETSWRGSDIGYDLKRVRNMKPLWSRYGTLIGVGLGGVDMWRLPQARQGRDADRLPEAGRRADLRPALLGLPLEHEPRGGPAAPPQREGHGAPEALGARRLRRTVSALLPRRGLRVDRGRGRGALSDQRAELRPLQDVRYQGPQPEHQLGDPGGSGRTELHGDVRRTPTSAGTR